MARSVASREHVLAVARDAYRTAAQDGQWPTMDELAAAAGVSRATLYRLVGSQQALLGELGLSPVPSLADRILHAALDLVGRDGLGELSMDELAAAAGVSRAMLYRLFPGKAALFAALVRAHSPLEPIAAMLADADDRPPAVVIPALLRAVATALEGRVGLLLQLLFEVARATPSSALPAGPAAASAAPTGQGRARGHAAGAPTAAATEAAAAMSRTLPLVTGYLAGQMRAGRLRPMDPMLAFQALVGPVFLHLLTPWPVSAATDAAAVDQFAALWLRAMTPDIPPDPAST